MSDETTQQQQREPHQEAKHREAVRSWRLEHPDYYAQWNAKRKADRDALGWSAKDGSLPVPQIKGKPPYTVNVRRPLKPHERRQPPPSTKRRPKTHEPIHHSTSETFDADT